MNISRIAPSSAAIVVALLLLCGPALLAQEIGLTEERSAVSNDNAGENFAGQSRMSLGSGERKLEQAKEIDEKIAAESDSKKRAKLEARQVKTYQSAVGDFRKALSSDAKMIQAWAGLGAAYRGANKTDESLQAYVECMKLDAEADDCFTGWAGTLMDGNKLGNAVQAHGQLTQMNPKRAAILIEVMETWLKEKQADPGGLAQTDIDQMATWLAAHQ
jgi:tetratricopeptide (TPR) repeat protein